MRTLLRRWPIAGPGLVAGLIVALLLLPFVCPILMPESCTGGQQACQSHPCWLLVLGPSVLVVAVFAGLVRTAHGTPVLAYPSPLFRRPHTLPRLFA